MKKIYFLCAFGMLISNLSITAQTSISIYNLPLDITVDCSNIPGPSEPMVDTNCGEGTPTILLTEEVIDVHCTNSYTLNRVWTATDPCGNTTTAIQQVFADDNTAPELEDIEQDIFVYCDEIPSMLPLSTTDNCSTNLDIDMVEYSNNTDCNSDFIITRIWRATDECGNMGSRVQYVHVQATPLSTAAENIENLQEAVNVYPNPASDYLTVALPQDIGPATIKLFNTSGKKIHTLAANGTRENINLESYPSGLYFVQIETPAGPIYKNVNIIRQ